MATRRWLKIGVGAGVGIVSIFAFFSLLVSLYGFQITNLTGDIVCKGTYKEPCFSDFTVRNPNPYYVDIYNQNEIKLDFVPDIKDYALFVKDGRCKTNSSKCASPSGIWFSGWRYIDFTNKTKPLADKLYVFRFPAYTTINFRIVGVKYNPENTIKWSFGIKNKELDPYWKGTGLASITATYIYTTKPSQANIDWWSNVKKEIKDGKLIISWDGYEASLSVSGEKSTSPVTSLTSSVSIYKKDNASMTWDLSLDNRLSTIDTAIMSIKTDAKITREGNTLILGNGDKNKIIFDFSPSETNAKSQGYLLSIDEKNQILIKNITGKNIYLDPIVKYTANITRAAAWSGSATGSTTNFAYRLPTTTAYTNPGDYNLINTNNGLYKSETVALDGLGATGKIGHQIRFNITQTASSVTKITVLAKHQWEQAGYIVTANDLSLYLGKVSTATWEQKATEAYPARFTWYTQSGTNTTIATNYINQSNRGNFIYVETFVGATNCAVEGMCEGASAELDLDYVELNITYTVAGDSTKPKLWLKNPVNLSTSSVARVYFKANFTDETALKNATLYVWNKTTLIGINATTIIGLRNTTNRSLVLPREGAYNWTYKVYDTTGNWNQSIRNWSVTYTIPDTTKPIIIIKYPTNTTYNYAVNKINYTVIETNKDSCWYHNITGINSTKVAAGTNFSSVISIEGSNKYTVWCNDTSNNKNSTSVQFTKITVTNTCTSFLTTGIVNCADNCIWNNNLNISKNIFMIGKGNLTLNAIFHFNKTNQYIYIGKECKFTINKGGEIK